jgi:hypothetical protein
VGELVPGDGPVILLREIDIVGKLSLEIDQCIAETGYPAGKSAIELTQRGLSLSRDRRIHQVPDGLRLQQVEFAVEHRLGESPGQRISAPRGREQRAAW